MAADAREEAIAEILRAIKEKLDASIGDGLVVVRLAEAYAWLVAPGNSHGGGSTPPAI